MWFTNTRSLFVTLVYVISFCVHTKATKILIVGDSNGEFMGTTLDSLCLGSEIQNAAIGGTTADDWSEYSSDVLEGCEGGKWDVVHISVGGNDVLQSGCSIGASKLASKIVLAVKNIMENIAPNASKYLLTGYCMPAGIEGDERSKECSRPSDFNNLRTALLDVKTDLPNNVEVIDSTFVCEGSSSSFSNDLYFQDAIHLNSKGYCQVFMQPAVQEYLSCTDRELNCKKLDFEIYGLDKHCRNGPPSRQCTDDTTWKFKGNAKKNCAWVKTNAKRCKKKYKGVEASKACPIACKSTQCMAPTCKEDSDWVVKLKNGKEKNCKYLKNKKKCGLIGTDKTFGYESCGKCGECELNK